MCRLVYLLEGKQILVLVQVLVLLLSATLHSRFASCAERRRFRLFNLAEDFAAPSRLAGYVHLILLSAASACQAAVLSCPVRFRWTTYKQLLQDGHKNLLKEEEPCVLGIGTEPTFANGNRALLIQTGGPKAFQLSSQRRLSGHSSLCLESACQDEANVPQTEPVLCQACTARQHAIAQDVPKPHVPSLAGEGNILWDCITVLDDDARAHIRSLGGIKAIAVSHPHFYTRMVDWAEEFDAIVYVHAADKQFIVQPSERINYWTGAGT